MENKVIELEVKPLKSVGNICFGMTRNAVRDAMQSYGKPQEFRKTMDSANTTDDYGFCHVYYDEQDRCEAVEVFEGTLKLQDKIIFPDYVDTIAEMIAFDVDGDDYTSEEQSIGIYAPDGIIEAILFGKKGYYTE